MLYDLETSKFLQFLIFNFVKLSKKTFVQFNL